MPVGTALEIEYSVLHSHHRCSVLLPLHQKFQAVIQGLEALPDESALDFCVRMGWEDYIYQMLIVDYLILNRDRHGANIEVLRNSRKKTIRPAPLFDHGLSLLCSCSDDAAAATFDVMADKHLQQLYRLEIHMGESAKHSEG